MCKIYKEKYLFKHLSGKWKLKKKKMRQTASLYISNLTEADTDVYICTIRNLQRITYKTRVKLEVYG